MRKKLVAVAACAVIGSMVGADVASAIATSLSIKAPRKVKKGAKATISGTLSSSDAGCPPSSTIQLYKGSKLVKTTTTNGLGKYSFKLKIRKKTTVRTKFPGKTQTHPAPNCDASQSAKKTIKVG